MSQFYKSDKKKTEIFYQENKEIINNFFEKNTKLFNIEFENSEISKLFDQYCGMDYVVKNGKSVFGIAARVNFKRKHHNHITIRYKRTTGAETEFSKRVKQIKNKAGNIYASITMQIDAKENELLRAIIFESNQLYLHIDRNLKHFEANYMETCSYDGNKFFRLSHKDVIDLSAIYGFRAKLFDNAPLSSALPKEAYVSEQKQLQYSI